MLPAHQGLRTRQNGILGADIILGLEVYHKAVVFQGGLEIFQQSFPVKLRFMHFGIVYADCFPETAPDRVGGDLRIIKAALDLKRFIHLRVYAHAQPDAVRGNILIHKALGCFGQNAVIILPVRAVDQEGVRAAPACHTADFPGYLADLPADTRKHAVSVLLSIALIKHMEMIDVQNDCIHQHFLIVLVIHPDVAEEVIEVEKVRQAVAFRGLDDAALLGKLDTPGDTGLDDLGARIRLGNKVDRSDFQAVIRRHHNDRYVPQLLLFLHDLQDIHAAHPRHLKVQHHERKVILMGFNLLQGFDAVRCVQDIISLLIEHIAQDHLVDVLVLHDQDMALKMHDFRIFIHREQRLSFCLRILA